MWVILLLILLLFFVVPAIKAYLAYRRLKNRLNEMFGFGNGQNARGGRTSENEHFERERHRSRRKKIDASVGEYVEFEEIAVDADMSRKVETGPAETRFRAESQIVDVEWEDIKE